MGTNLLKYKSNQHIAPIYYRNSFKSILIYLLPDILHTYIQKALRFAPLDRFPSKLTVTVNLSLAWVKLEKFWSPRTTRRNPATINFGQKNLFSFNFQYKPTEYNPINSKSISFNTIDLLHILISSYTQDSSSKIMENKLKIPTLFSTK